MRCNSYSPTDLSSTEFQSKLSGFHEAGDEFGLQHFMYDNHILLENIFGHLSLTNFNGIVVSCSYA